MHFSRLCHLTDGALRRELLSALSKERHAAAVALAHLAEFDARKLYVAEGYPSMFRFCVGQLGFSDGGAGKRIQAARTAREFPAIWDMLADGRLSASAVCLLAPRLEPENADELLAAAAGRSKRALELYLASRFPRQDQALEVAPLDSASAPSPASGSGEDLGLSHPPGDVTPPERPGVSPLSPERYGVRFTMGETTHDAMHAFEQLAGRKVTSEHMNEALRRGFEAMAKAIEKRRFAATERPRRQARPAKGRHIPAAVKRAVRSRDGDRCTFVAASGHRCDARGKLEFDHIEPVARGGRSTVDNLRLRCRAHNQYEAEQVFGAGFMNGKRKRARGPAGVRREDGEEGMASNACGSSEEGTTSIGQAGATGSGAERATGRSAIPPDPALDVTPWLLRLGFRKADALRAAEHCGRMTGATLEERVRAALRCLAPPAKVTPPPRPAAAPA